MDGRGRAGKETWCSQHVEQYADHASLHGVWQVTTSSRSALRRGTWLFALCLCLGLLLYAFITQVSQFLRFPVQSIVLVEDVTSLTFPTVTICNYNQFRKSVATQSPDIAAKLQSLFPILDGIDGPGGPGAMRSARFMHFTTGSNVNVTRQLISLAHQEEDMFLACYWAGRRVTCSDYIEMRMTELGVCYSFNSAQSQMHNGPLIVHDSGTDHGLLIRFNIQNEEYFYGEGSSAGLKVRFHRPEEMPMIRQRGFSLAPGTTTTVALSLVEGIMLPAPYGSCITSDEAEGRTLRHPGTYTSEACKLELRADYVYDQCGCKMFYDLGNRPVCKSEEEMTCARKAKENYRFNVSANARELCPRTCYSQKYSSKLSTAAFPGQHVVEELQHKYGMDEAHVRKNFLQLLVYFEDTSVQRLQEVPEYTFASLLGDIGGQMGLCLGASLLTIVEILEFCLLAARGSSRRVQN